MERRSNNDGGLRRPFDSADFEAVLKALCRSKGDKPPVGVEVRDRDALRSIAFGLGFTQAELSSGLHRRALEKLTKDERKKLGIVLDSERKKRRRLLVAAIGGLCLLAAAGTWFLLDRFQDEKAVAVEVTGSIDSAALGKSFDSLADLVRGCLADADANAVVDLPEHAELSFLISTAGKTDLVEEKDGPPLHKHLRKCALRAIDETVFPRAKEASVKVLLPLDLKTDAASQQ